jgi:hypothetical protein
LRLAERTNEAYAGAHPWGDPPSRHQPTKILPGRCSRQVVLDSSETAPE